MLTSTTHHSSDEADEEDDVCDDEPIWPVVLATTSALFLGYLLGRVGYRRDLQEALDLIEASPEPVEVFIPTL